MLWGIFWRNTFSKLRGFHMIHGPTVNLVLKPQARLPFYLWFSKGGSQTSSISKTWELDRHANSWIKSSETGVQHVSASPPSDRFPCMLKSENHCLTQSLSVLSRDQKTSLKVSSPTDLWLSLWRPFRRELTNKDLAYWIQATFQTEDSTFPYSATSGFQHFPELCSLKFSHSDEGKYKHSRRSGFWCHHSVMCWVTSVNSLISLSLGILMGKIRLIVISILQMSTFVMMTVLMIVAIT